MSHDSPLIALLSVGFGLAFVFGAMLFSVLVFALAGPFGLFCEGGCGTSQQRGHAGCKKLLDIRIHVGSP